MREVQHADVIGREELGAQKQEKGDRMVMNSEGDNITVPITIDTSSGIHDGLNRCPYCGSTDIFTQPGIGKLRCRFCHKVFELGQSEGYADEQQLTGEQIGSGSANITLRGHNQVTLKCQGCGAEVVIDINEALSARCHWCRHVLSIENQVSNGAVPDLVLPFILSKEDALVKMQEFIKKRVLFTRRRFKQELTSENIIGLFMPHIIVDANIHSCFQGQAGHIASQYYNIFTKETHYTIDIYTITREFDLVVDDLAVVASSSRRKDSMGTGINNVISLIQPFDIQNSVPYNGNYLKGFNSERRDTNLGEIQELVDRQIADVSRAQANSTAAVYDAGIRWEQEEHQINGKLWKTVYLPVWLYSYRKANNYGNDLLLYVAVNARTGKTIGSIPMNFQNLVVASIIIEGISLLTMSVLLLLGIL
jgi:DNA-directed RNA polymerase subunit RPC12/RpoP